MKKKIFFGYIILLLLGGIIIFAIAVISVINMNLHKNINPMADSSANIKYRTEINPIADRFPNIKHITKCYWISETIGSSGNFTLGPTNYKMKALIELNNETNIELQKNYIWEKREIKIDDDLSPTKMGYKQSNWAYNKEYQNLILGNSFIGDVFLDTINGLLYLDVENL